MTKPIGGPGQPSPKPSSQSFVSKVTGAIRDIATPIFERIGNLFSRKPLHLKEHEISPTEMTVLKKTFVLDPGILADHIDEGAKIIPDDVTDLSISRVDLTNLKIPNSVQVLHLDGCIIPPEFKIPEGVKILKIRGHIPPGLEIPESVQRLNLTGCMIPPGFKIPEGVNTLALEGSDIPSGFNIPKSVKHLFLQGAFIQEGDRKTPVENSRWYRELLTQLDGPKIGV